MALIPQNITDTINKNRSTGSNVLQAFLLIVVLVLFSWFLMKPKISQSLQTRAELKVANDQKAKIALDEKEMKALVEKLHSSPDDVALVDEALPLSGRISKVDVLLDKMVRDSGMTLTLLSADDTSKVISAGDKNLLENPFQPGRTLHTMTVSASVSGTMEQLKNLLHLMESNGRVLDVESLQILGGDPVTRFKITVKAYAYEPILSSAPPTNAASANPPTTPATATTPKNAAAALNNPNQ